MGVWLRMKVVKVLEAIEVVSVTGKPRRRRVAIFQRDDGYFTFAEGYFYAEYEGEIITQGWAPLQGGIYPSTEMAEADGRLLLQRQPDYGGMTTHERLFATDLFNEYKAAARKRDRTKMIELLSLVDLASHAERIVDTVLANPSKYRF